MADQLTSVRFARETLDTLKLLADLNDSSVAAEIREAVAQHIHSVTSAPDFAARVEAKQELRRRETEERVATLTAASRGARSD